MATASQLDIENRFGPGGSEGTNYTVTLTTDGDVHICTVTDDDNSDAVVVTRRALSEADSTIGARRALGVDDLVLFCLTTTQKNSLTGVRDGSQLIDATLNEQETRQSGEWVGGASTVETEAFTGTSLTLLDEHSGKHLTFDNGSDITVTLDTGLKSGFKCSLEQIGVGQVQVSANGTTINSLAGATKTIGPFAVADLVQTSADVFTLSRDITS